jgi:DUF4097 and DUF4098 domain-containing protein YvlB
MEWTFAVAGPIDASLELASGSISVTARSGDEATVVLEPLGRNIERALEVIEAAEVTCDGKRLIVKVRKQSRRETPLRMEVTLPDGSSLRANAASADVSAHGYLGDVEINTASGDIDSTGEVESAKVNTASGDTNFARVRSSANANSASGELSFESVGGRLTLSTASGGVEVGDVAGDASVSTASGDIRVHRLGASGRMRSASGDVELCLVERGEVSVSTTSGDVLVYVAKGVGTWLDLTSYSGSTNCSLPAEDGNRSGAELRLTCQTVSGDIDVRMGDEAGSQNGQSHQLAG